MSDLHDPHYSPPIRNLMPARKFAVSGGNKFVDVSYRIGANGAPILNGTIGYIECRVVSTYDGGDHTIYLGEIEQAEARDARPLLFFRGGYRALGD